MTSAQETILTALRAHGPATAAVIAERTGLGYSTVTASLRKLAAAGHVHRDDTNTWTAATDTSTPPAAQVVPTAGPLGAAVTEPQATPLAPDPASIEAADQSDADIEHTGDPTGVELRQPEPASPVEAVTTHQDDPHHNPEPGIDADAQQSDGDLAASKPRRRYTRSGKPVRKKKQLQGEVLAYLTARPGQPVTPHTIAKDVDATGGAVINACTKLAHDGAIERVETTKAMFVYHAPTEAA